MTAAARKRADLVLSGSGIKGVGPGGCRRRADRRQRANDVSNKTRYAGLKTLCRSHRERQRPLVKCPTAYP